MAGPHDARARYAPSTDHVLRDHDAWASRSARKTVVFILSTSFAGSHYLSLMLGSHSRARHVGELHRVREPHRDTAEPVCFACRDVNACPVFGGIAPESARDVFDILFGRSEPAVSILVDNSKLARGWVKLFLDDRRYDHRYIHLIRDPRALVRRWSLDLWLPRPELLRRWRMLREFPGSAHRLLFAPRADVLAYQWLQQNRQISRLIERNGLNAQTVTYRDLAVDPAGEIERLMSWLGQRYEPGQLDYWNFAHHGTQKGEYEWVKQGRTRHFDLRWQEDLDAPLQRRIIGNPDVRGYLERLGLASGADGLTRHLAPNSVGSAVVFASAGV